MSNFTAEGFAAHLIRTFTPRLPRGYAPRATPDTDDKGREILLVTMPNPHDPRHSVALTATCRGEAVTTCALWFGAVEVTGALDPADAVAAVEEILAGNLVAIVRYKNRDAYDACRKASAIPSQWLYQMPDDTDELSRMTARLSAKPGLVDRLTGHLVGVFEMYDWERTEIMER